MDIALQLIPQGMDPPRMGVSLSGFDMAADDGLHTAVLLSLFTDARASATDLTPDGSDDLRGWWADAWAEIDGDQFGSRLWLLDREKLLPEVAIRADGWARDALAWMIDDGIASDVVVNATIAQPSLLQLTIEIVRAAGGRFEATFNITTGGVYAV